MQHTAKLIPGLRYLTGPLPRGRRSRRVTGCEILLLQARGFSFAAVASMAAGVAAAPVAPYSGPICEGNMTGGQQLDVSLSPVRVSEYIRRLRQHRPCVLYGDRHTLEACCAALLACGAKARAPEVNDNGEWEVPAVDAVLLLPRSEGGFISTHKKLDRWMRTRKSLHHTPQVLLAEAPLLRSLTDTTRELPKLATDLLITCVSNSKIHKDEVPNLTYADSAASNPKAAEDIYQAAISISGKASGVILIIGSETDVVVEAASGRVASLTLPVKQLTRVLGWEAGLAGVCAASIAANSTDVFGATLTALLLYRHAAREAQKEARGPGTLGVHLLDQLFRVAYSPDLVQASEKAVEIAQVKVVASAACS